MELGKVEAERIEVSSKEVEDYYNNAKKVAARFSMRLPSRSRGVSAR